MTNTGGGVTVLCFKRGHKAQGLDVGCELLALCAFTKREIVVVDEVGGGVALAAFVYGVRKSSRIIAQASALVIPGRFSRAVFIAFSASIVALFTLRLSRSVHSLFGAFDWRFSLIANLIWALFTLALLLILLDRITIWRRLHFFWGCKRLFTTNLRLAFGRGDFPICFELRGQLRAVLAFDHTWDDITGSANGAEAENCFGNFVLFLVIA